MNIKISKEEIDSLRAARNAYDVKNSEIAGKALRKYKRLKPSLDVENLPSTTNGESYRFKITTDLKPKMIRAILHWYLQMNIPPKNYKENQFKPKYIEGLDYNVPSHRIKLRG